MKNETFFALSASLFSVSAACFAFGGSPGFAWFTGVLAVVNLARVQTCEPWIKP